MESAFENRASADGGGKSHHNIVRGAAPTIARARLARSTPRFHAKAARSTIASDSGTISQTMIAKRIRCECGRVYDTEKHKKCPDCGASILVATAEQAKPPPLPPEAYQSAARSTSQSGQLPTPSPLPINPRVLIITAGALLRLIFPGLFIHHFSSSKKSEVVRRDRSIPSESASPQDQTSPVIPPAGVSESAELEKMIAKAKAGATVKVPPGLYRGGLVLTRPVRIVGDSKSGGQV